LVKLWCLAVIIKQAESQKLQQPASWRSCSNSAAFHINAVDLEPSSVVPPGGRLSIVVDGANQQQVTAGVATVTVWYYGVRVLTATDTLCPQAAMAAQQSVSQRQLRLSKNSLLAASSSWSRTVLSGWQDAVSQSIVGDATCTLGAGPLHMTHTATLPSIAPRGSYSMRLAAADMLTGQQIMCLDVWFKVG
jgi:hypothetical protein